jgi:hypothetical protein
VLGDTILPCKKQSNSIFISLETRRKTFATFKINKTYDRNVLHNCFFQKLLQESEETYTKKNIFFYPTYFSKKQIRWAAVLFKKIHFACELTEEQL